MAHASKSKKLDNLLEEYKIATAEIYPPNMLIQRRKEFIIKLHGVTDIGNEDFIKANLEIKNSGRKEVEEG